jgi:hypothetical protein
MQTMVRYVDVIMGFLCLYAHSCILVLTLQGLRWRQHVSPKRRFPPTSLHGVTTQNNIVIITDARTSNLKSSATLTPIIFPYDAF